MASMRKNTNTERMARETVFALDRTRRSIPSPAPAPDIPHPLDELPPEVTESNRASRGKKVK